MHYYSRVQRNFLCVQMVQLLIEKGTTINSYDKKERRALHWAAFMGHLDVATVLVAKGAEVNCRDKQVSKVTTVILPCYHSNMGHLDVATVLVAKEAEVNCRDKKVSTLLPW